MYEEKKLHSWMSLDEDAKKALPFIKAVVEGKELINSSDEKIIALSVCFYNTQGRKFHIGSVKIIEPVRCLPWRSISEMGEAINDWFRSKNTGMLCKIVGILKDTVYFQPYNDSPSFEELYKSFEHSPTPWIEDSWKPCGIEKGIEER